MIEDAIRVDSQCRRTKRGGKWRKHIFACPALQEYRMWCQVPVKAKEDGYHWPYEFLAEAILQHRHVGSCSRSPEQQLVACADDETTQRFVRGVDGVRFSAMTKSTRLSAVLVAADPCSHGVTVDYLGSAPRGCRPENLGAVRVRAWFCRRLGERLEFARTSGQRRDARRIDSFAPGGA